MKHTLLYIAALALITACSSDNDTYTVGEENNLILLSAGMNEKNVTSRAGDQIAMSVGIKANLQVTGTWTGHNPSSIVKTTMATMGTATNNRNAVSLSPSLYWDDYGTADPANTNGGTGEKKGREIGLTILGVGINDASVSAPTFAGTIDWTLEQNQSNGWSKKDLIITNNVSGSNTYKFTEQTATNSKELEFRHAMSQVSVILTAGKGFETAEDPNKKFVNEPTVTLKGFYTSGKVTVSDGSPSEAGTVADITTYCTNETKTGQTSVTRTALVFPTRKFDGTEIIAKVSADGNTYEVNSSALQTALGGADKPMEPGKNYVLQITVNKTDIVVTATLRDWENVEATTVEPEIKVTTAIGTDTSDKNDAFTSFDFYLSDNASSSPATAYEKRATASSTATDGNATDGNAQWAFSTPLYWPSHDTHYHMRGVFPTSTTVSAGKIDVANADYNAATYPSNLLVGAPIIATGTMCDNSDHTAVDMSEKGICAREANINLTFNYMMSQVEVRLTTSSSNDKVEIAGAKVEIINSYKEGIVDIHTKTVSVKDNTISDFEINHITDENSNYRHSIVVPQNLNNGTDDLKFKITITNTDGTKDIYYATIKGIYVKEKGETVEHSIDKWESGKHYIYTLDMRKTEIKVSATITDWTEVSGSDDVWF